MKAMKVLGVLSILLVLFWSCEQDSPSIAGNEVQDIDAGIENELTPEDFGYGLEKNSSQTGRFEIKLYNLTPATGPGASQVFSPPVFATHNKSIKIFKNGGYASDELAQVAEDAVNQPLVDLLNGTGLTQEVITGDGVVFPGADATYEIEASASNNRLSGVWMLVNTNDAFGGGNSLNLPRRGTRTFYIAAWDAGSEANTELAEHIPGPCCGNGGVRVPTQERIRKHKGIKGIGDLDPATYDWGGRVPVAKLVVTRID